MALDLVLTRAGFAVCGVAGTEADALRLGEKTAPEFAIVDLVLAPGGGRAVSKQLWAYHRTTVQYATAHFQESDGLARSGAIACLQKPFSFDVVPKACEAVRKICAGRPPERLPYQMVALPR